ncbi:MAG: flavodoxin-dependent (E)-4-hydroxy-3-methylbut-2-enyl-diphosphate synthase [Clostridiales bacterium]|nr:flavodoxin-dependent (E)-4-hydroxy-3-methylbut-2-enyl-diphosphate synthase [Clostridiales bacterium]
MAKTRKVQVKTLAIGGGAPVSIQSMTNTDTRDLAATQDQIAALSDAGCELVRVSVFDEVAADNVRALVDASPLPLVADIHFDHKLAILAAEGGISKLRINPGNLKNAQAVRQVVAAAKAHRIPIRVGVNSGSIPKEIRARDQGVTARGLVDSALGHIHLLEQEGFSDIVVSMKSSDVRLTVEAYRLASRTFDYPLHLGVTEAGLPGQGTVKSAIGIGALLLDGIGDTVRVSLTGSPIPEVKAARDILRAIGLRGGIEVISCPTCGRTRVDVEALAKAVEARTQHIQADLKVAVMGCPVNGPGEALDADIALCGGNGNSALYLRGVFVKKVSGDPEEELMHFIEEYLAKRKENG